MAKGFDAGGKKFKFTSIRWFDWKPNFAATRGNIATDFLARNIWLLVLIQDKIKEFFQDYGDFPHQEGSALNASGIGHELLKQQDAMKRLKQLEPLHPT
jgi:hypothetical protein